MKFLKKTLKICLVTSLIIGIFSNYSYAINKDDFLNMLIKSSYPEVSTSSNTKVKNDVDSTKNQTNTTESKEKSSASESKSTNTNTSEDSDYVKIYVGEENIPKDETKDSTLSTSATLNVDGYVSAIDYKNNIRVTSEKPQILIYHTHSCETYADSNAGNYHSTDIKNSVMEVGSVLTDELTKDGWGVVHSTKYHDLDFKTAYASSLKTAQEEISKYKTIQLAIDLHREGLDLEGDNAEQKLHDRYTTKIDGKNVAKFFFVIGGKNENSAQLKKMAEEITAIAEKKYPGITAPIIEKDYAKFNQFVTPNHNLIEVGSNGSTVEEAKASAVYLADVLNEYYAQKLTK
ncbi:MAG: stage II sporulation protein P [Clostridioides sp.]|jgi:stage II sporulation protein P|nr:stage II sporulation protein P [Clostridioides sp.]